MLELLQRFSILPPTSIFRSHRPVYLIVLNFLLAIPENIINLQLAWRSIGLKIGVRRTLLPGTVKGLLVMFVRQLVVLPAQAVVDIALTTIFTLTIGKTSLLRALLATFFAEFVAVMGSILLMEPLYALVGNATKILSDPAWGFLLWFLETALPALVLLIFVRYDLSLVGRKDG